MSTRAVDGRVRRSLRFYDSTIGKKVVMAVTGILLFGFIISHMAANLQVFAGPEALNGYALKLREFGPLLWAARGGLLFAAVLHIVASFQLIALQKAARPVGYAKRANVGSSYASRTMRWSGPILLAFVIYHLLHFTTGNAHPQFEHLRPYENVVAGFQSVPVVIAYLIAMGMLCLHLHHGLWSMFQTLGASHPRYTPKLRGFAAVTALAIFLGFSVVPIAVVSGWVG